MASAGLSGVMSSCFVHGSLHGTGVASQFCLLGLELGLFCLLGRLGCCLGLLPLLLCLRREARRAHCADGTFRATHAPLSRSSVMSDSPHNAAQTPPQAAGGLTTAGPPEIDTLTPFTHTGSVATTMDPGGPASAIDVDPDVVEVAPPTPGSRPGESHSDFPHPRPVKRTRPSEVPTPVKRSGDAANPLQLN